MPTAWHAFLPANYMDLFPDTLPVPQGFRYAADFLTGAEEAALLQHIRNIALKPMIFQGFEAKRKTESFGYDYSFDNRRLSKGKDIPVFFEPLLRRVAAFLGINAADIAELLLTEYPPGAVINWHRDAPPFKTIIGISLLEDCVFKFRPHDKAQQTRKSVISLPVARRSLYVIDGPARSDWQHSIAPVKATRYSITLRTLI
jgi:alkylated DNA repair dioxygenase AlkB